MLITQATRPIAAFAHLGGKKYQGAPSRALRRRLRTPEKKTVSQWANDHRFVTGVDSAPGDWHSAMVPHLTKPMDAVSLPHVRQVWMCAPERAGKTQLMLNAACWGKDQGSKGGSIFWLMPKEKDARDAMGDRILPVFKHPGRPGRRNPLRKYLSSYADDSGRGMVRFNDGTFLRPAWSNSPSSLASYFGFMNLGDEIDKYPLATSEGTDPITLFLKRARDDRHRSKYVFASTPGNRYIYKGTMAAQQVWQYQVRCPDCGALVNPTGDHLDLAAGASIEQVARDGCKLACAACGVLWGEAERDEAYRGGTWVCIKGADISRPHTIGFHMTALVLPRVTLIEIGVAYLRGKQGDSTDRNAWANGYLVEDYKHASAERDDSAIIALCDTRPADQVPVADINELLLTVDTQKNYFWYTLRAHGFGIDQESWLVSSGMLNSFAAIDQMLDQHVYLDAEGNEYRIAACAIDSGGTKNKTEEHSRTYQVYDWARGNPKIYVFKGAHRGAKPWTVTKIDNYPNGKPMRRGGLRLYNVNSNLYKDELSRRLSINPTDPGAFHLHSGYSSGQLQDIASGEKKPQSGLAEYARHMVGEARDERGQWDPISGRRHDYWDCENYQIILADIRGIKHNEKPQPEPEPVPKKKLSILQERRLSRENQGGDGDGWEI